MHIDGVWSVNINEKLLDSCTCVPRILPNFWFHIPYTKTHTIPCTLHHGTRNEIFQALFPFMGILQPIRWEWAWEWGYISLSTLVWLLQDVDFLDIVLGYFSKQSTNLTSSAQYILQAAEFGHTVDRLWLCMCPHSEQTVTVCWANVQLKDFTKAIHGMQGKMLTDLKKCYYYFSHFLLPSVSMKINTILDINQATEHKIIIRIVMLWQDNRWHYINFGHSMCM